MWGLADLSDYYSWYFGPQLHGIQQIFRQTESAATRSTSIVRPLGSAKIYAWNSMYVYCSILCGNPKIFICTISPRKFTQVSVMSQPILWRPHIAATFMGKMEFHPDMIETKWDCLNYYGFQWLKGQFIDIHSNPDYLICR